MHRRIIGPRVSALALLVAGCTGGQVGSGECDARVAPGGDDHAALSEALAALQDGQTLCLAAGRFMVDGPLTLDGASDITIAGADPEQSEPTVLDFTAQTDGDALTIANATALSLRDLTIESAFGRGVVIDRGEGVEIERLTVLWDPEMPRGGDGLAIVGSRNVRVGASSFAASSAAGAIVTRSETVLLEECDAFDNVAGFVLEDSRGCELRGNNAELNGLGFVVADTPEASETAGANTLRDNLALENNAILDRPAGSLLSHLPGGVGILILAADDTEVTGNHLDTNATSGVMILSYTTLIELAGAPEAGDGYDPHPELVHVHGDTYFENGIDPATAADPFVLELLSRSMLMELADVVWDGALASDGRPGTLCFAPDAESPATFLDLDARNGFAAPSTDGAPHACTHPEHEPVQL